MGVGPIAEAGSNAFDMFWNSEWTVPIAMIVDTVPTEDDARAFKQTLDTAGEDQANYPPGYSDVGTINDASARLKAELMWGPSRLIYDPAPGTGDEPVDPKKATNFVGEELRKIADQTHNDIIFESAYLILTDASTQHLEQLKGRGLTVMALTNSLATNNHTTAFVGYRKQRDRQIRLFSELYEYRPDAVSQTELYQQLAPGQPVPHFALHAKTSVYDRKVVFIGSFNLDPRSENLNTEIGILVESPELGREVARNILEDMGPGNAWRVRINKHGHTEWVTIEGNREAIESDAEPMTSSGQRIEADLAQPLTPASEM
jgi:putative cardiolipin synthase